MHLRRSFQSPLPVQPRDTLWPDLCILPASPHFSFQFHQNKPENFSLPLGKSVAEVLSYNFRPVFFSQCLYLRPKAKAARQLRGQGAGGVPYPAAWSWDSALATLAGACSWGTVSQGRGPAGRQLPGPESPLRGRAERGCAGSGWLPSAGAIFSSASPPFSPGRRCGRLQLVAAALQLGAASPAADGSW